MDKKVKEQEAQNLKETISHIEKVRDASIQKIKKNEKAISDFKAYFAENFYDIHTGNREEFGDEDQFADINTQIEHFEQQNLALKSERDRLGKQKKNPYFGRFDFKENGQNLPQPYYVGLGFVQDETGKNWVYDWRADVCSLYYDDKMGETSYTCPDGQINGEVPLKRQFKIENGNLLYYIDSGMLIDDEILMQELSKNATSKMHEIAATIQKEQNVLIRDDDFENTIVQGVAGSGKTSIAMHRVSYLLFKYRKTLKSDDILILSPSEMFADYIDEVLPSLGEQHSFTTTFSTLAKRLLGRDFQSREALLEQVTTTQNQKDFQNIAIKSSFDFLEDLKKFIYRDMCNLFLPKNMTFGQVTITKEELSDIYFKKLSGIAIHKRIDVLAENIVERFNLSNEEHEELIARAKKLLYAKFLTCDPLEIYNIFLRSLELDEVDSVGAYDVAPVLLIKENLFGLKTSYDAKYVIIDEMQDYTPCHFLLFDKIWKCPKLYLGDIYQSIDRTITPDYLMRLAKETKSQIKFLTKSYRSTLQISLFSQKILGRRVGENVNRSGEEVECIKSKNIAMAIETILEKEEEKKRSVAIICKTQEEISKLQKASGVIKKFKVLGSSGSITKSKKIITTVASAKGVEFDCVIVPFADSENYKNGLDRNLLYVASTRALHKLYFVSGKSPSKFLMKNTKTSA